MSRNSTTVSAIDPNDKIAPTGHGVDGYIPAGNPLPYQILFENKPEATAPAQRVLITDTLDDDLDLSTFELFDITFGEHTLLVPPGLSHYQTSFLADAGGTEILIDVQAGLNFDTRELTLTLEAIDPATGWMPEDPLVGLLYPNDSTGRGEGSISYIIDAKEDLPSGTQIHNRANIFFDYNDPILTPQALNTIDAGVPASSISPLPATTTEFQFPLEWTGQDEPGGSGIAGYDVFVSVDNGPYFLYLENLAETSTTANVEPGHTYAFYTIARDNVGHVEAPPALPDATITTLSSLQVLAGVGQEAVEGSVAGLPQSRFIYFADLADLSGTVNWGDGTVEPVRLIAGFNGGNFTNRTPTPTTASTPSRSP